MTWRERAAPIIAQTLVSTQGKPEAEIRQALRDAYPFGTRQYHPYRIWCDEIRVQRGLKQPKWKHPHREPSDPRQGDLL